MPGLGLTTCIQNRNCACKALRIVDNLCERTTKAYSTVIGIGSPSEELHFPPGQANVTPLEQRYTSDSPPNMHQPRAANAHGITPFTKSYITPAASGTDGDTGQDQEQPEPGITVFLQPIESTTRLSLLPVEPPNNGNNGGTGDTAIAYQEPDRTELLLERLNTLMNAIQHPPAYGQEASP
ncbi:hypothetical protein BDP27DRAFT_1426572 [Rhodocollybia butyracea]|uniref:Uncharacterized protein n=1 Tax=Rhodocollybia butyracea TaxID=206335 RepID=A0A9P5U2R9_9AGAR|nr:hypothetical protein BDP27DRAFT_1426572 [Rhodocollybia butyracea]